LVLANGADAHFARDWIHEVVKTVAVSVSASGTVGTLVVVMDSGVVVGKRLPEGPESVKGIVIVGIPLVDWKKLWRKRKRNIQSLGTIQDAQELFLEQGVGIGRKVEVLVGLDQAGNCSKSFERHGYVYESDSVSDSSGIGGSFLGRGLSGYAS